MTSGAVTCLSRLFFYAKMLTMSKRNSNKTTLIRIDHDLKADLSELAARSPGVTQLDIVNKAVSDLLASVGNGVLVLDVVVKRKGL